MYNEPYWTCSGLHIDLLCTLKQGLNQQGVWVPFWTPKPLKRTPQDTQIFLSVIENPAKVPTSYSQLLQPLIADPDPRGMIRFLQDRGVLASAMTCDKCHVPNSPWIWPLGLGSIGTTSMDRQSRKIDVQHERTSIAELDTAPPTSIVFPTPKIQKSLPYSLKRPRRWAGRHWKCTTIDTIARGSTWKSVERNTQCMLHGAGPAPPHFSKHYRARQNRIEKIDTEKN